MKKNYIKLFTILVMLFSITLLTSCFTEDTTLEFVSYPKSVYTLSEDSTLNQIDLSTVKIKVNNDEELTVQEAMTKYSSINVSGYRFDKGKGYYTLMIKYESVTIQFTYYVGPVADIVDTTYDTSWYVENAGTEANPYKIGTVKQLLGMAAAVNGYTLNEKNSILKNAYYKLTANIDLKDVVWTPIGEGTRKTSAEINNETVTFNNKEFNGVFDGAGFTIANLSDAGYYPKVAGTYQTSDGTDVSNGYVYGIFGIISGAVIKNVKLTNVLINGVTIKVENDKVINYLGDSVGGIAGYQKEAGVPSVIDNCEVTNGSITAWDAVAGIVGRSYSSISFINCKNGANVQSLRLHKADSEKNTSESKAGGITSIISTESDFMFYRCSNSGNISSSGYRFSSAIVGNIMATPNNVYIVNCSNTGTCTMKTSNTNKTVRTVNQLFEISKTSEYYIGTGSTRTLAKKLFLVLDCTNEASNGVMTTYASITAATIKDGNNYYRNSENIELNASGNEELKDPLVKFIQDVDFEGMRNVTPYYDLIINLVGSKYTYSIQYK